MLKLFDAAEVFRQNIFRLRLENLFENPERERDFFAGDADYSEQIADKNRRKSAQPALIRVPFSGFFYVPRPF